LTHFLLIFDSYLCGAWLNPDHPYAHFNDPRNKHCFQRLMDGAEGEEGGVQFGGRRGAEQAAEFWEQEALRIQLQINEEDTR
jgi:E3 ubiquitin-protein ligase RNF14